jgi:hypothetical protein
MTDFFRLAVLRGGFFKLMRSLKRKNRGLTRGQKISTGQSLANAGFDLVDEISGAP